MDFEFSNKERAKSFPIEKSPWIFHSGMWQVLELRYISKALVVLGSFPLEEDVHPKPNPEGSFYR